MEFVAVHEMWLFPFYQIRLAISIFGDILGCCADYIICYNVIAIWSVCFMTWKFDLHIPLCFYFTFPLLISYYFAQDGMNLYPRPQWDCQ